ncbi:iron-containing alcohol dehydrogenase [Spongorhabdus nitratireducens]
MLFMTALYRTRLFFLRIAQQLLLGGEKPTTVIGPDSRLQLCKIMAGFNFRHIMIVTDKPLLELGITHTIQERLEQLDMKVSIFSGVKPDPTCDVIREGILHARQHDCDALLAVGGGSSIDAAKVMAICLANNKEPQQVVGILKSRKQALPLFVIPTTAGTGSETTVGAVLSDDVTHQKSLVIDPKLMPIAAAIDPVVMQKLPASVTAATGMDALTHAVEAYISTFSTRNSRFYAGAAARMIFENLPNACGEQSDDLEVREKMALAAYYAGLAITKAHVGNVHAIAHQLGGKYGIPHGLANAVLLPQVLELYRVSARQSLAELARISGIGELSMSDDQLVDTLISHIRQLNEKVGIPQTLNQVQQQDIPELADAALKEGNGYPVPSFMEKRQCESILVKVAE